MMSLAGLDPLPVTVKQAAQPVAPRPAWPRSAPLRTQETPLAVAPAPAGGGRRPQPRSRSGTCGSSGTTAAAAPSPRCGASTSSCGAARRSRCWAATEPGRAPCCAWPPGSCSRPGAPRGPRATSRCWCRRRPTTCCTNASCDELAPDVAGAALEELGLDHLADADPRDLSGGERQRLALGVVLAGRGIGAGAPPAVVALDEPTRGMDQQRKRDLAERIAGARGAGRGGDRRHARRRVRGPRGPPLRAARRRPRRGRRLDHRGARGRPLLHHRGGAGAGARGRRRCCPSRARRSSALHSRPRTPRPAREVAAL